MIELIDTGFAFPESGGLHEFQIENDFQIENFTLPSSNQAELAFESHTQAKVEAKNSMSGAAVDYMVGSKNSLVQKSIEIGQSFLGDAEFTFKDKMQLLEKTYSYQLEMTFYNTFMTQTIQKVDSLIQLK